jgi:hypothetical protein
MLGYAESHQRRSQVRRMTSVGFIGRFVTEELVERHGVLGCGAFE